MFVVLLSEPPRDAGSGAHQRAAEGQMAEVCCSHLLYQCGFLPHHHDHLYPGGLLPSDAGNGGCETMKAAWLKSPRNRSVLRNSNDQMCPDSVAFQGGKQTHLLESSK